MIMFPGNLNQDLSREALRVLAVVDVATVDLHDAMTDHQVCLSEEITLTAVLLFFCVFF